MNRDDIKEFLELAAGFKKSSRMLVEEEDEGLFGDEEEGGEEEDAGGDEEGGEGGEGDEEEEEEEEEVEVSKDEELELSKSLDDSLNALFIDIEANALKSAKIQEESFSFSLKKMLLSEAAPDIDLEVFASETARIIKNADVLLDIEQIIMSKARDYLLSKYDEEKESKFLDIMQSRFGIDLVADEEKEKAEEIIAPIAVGAGGGEGGGV